VFATVLPDELWKTVDDSRRQGFQLSPALHKVRQLDPALITAARRPFFFDRSSIQ